MKTHRSLVPVAAVIYALLLEVPGCSSGGGASSRSTPPDSTAPTVAVTTPADGSTGVATNAALSVTFSEAVDPATVNATTFSVKDPGDRAVEGTLSRSGATATFTPARSLNFLTPYTVTLTTGIKDTAGNALAAQRIVHFATATTPSPLISAATLKGWVDDGVVNGTGAVRVVVLDVTSATAYSAGHVPGAQLWSTTDLYQNRREGPAVDVNMVLDGPHVDALVQKYGIDDRTTIVLTTGSILNATRAYWTLRYWGFPKENLKLLDGCNTAWSAAFGVSTDAPPAVTPSSYGVKHNGALRGELRASLSEMIAVVSGDLPNAVILDARTAATSGSYAGVAGSTPGVFPPSGDYVVFEGRMKGAKAVDYTTMYDPTTLLFGSADVLESIFASVGVDATKTTYVHCRTGVIASLPFFVLDAILGWPAVNYDGSWSQWGQLSADGANGGKLSADSPWRTDVPSLSELVVYNHPTKPVELLSLDGNTCSSSLDTAGVITFSPAGCTPVAPESNAASGNQIEEEDAAYVSH